MIPQLYPFQQEDLETVDAFDGRALICWPPGCGKTVGSLYWAWLNKTARPVVVICPASVKYQWQRECFQHFGFVATVLEGRKPQGGIPQTDFYIINYDILAPTKRSQGWLEWIYHLNPKLVILDEGHALCNPSAARSKAAKTLCKIVPHVLITTGTPITSRPIQLWHLISILKPKLFPYRHQYGLQFCDAHLTHWGWDYSGASNLETLNDILVQKLLVRRRKEDILPQLPPQQRVVVPVGISNPREYHYALNQFLDWMRARNPHKLKAAERAQRLTQLGYLKRLAASLKMKSVKEWIDAYLEDTEEKLLVFGIHKPIIKELKEKYPKNSVVVDGSVTGKKRQQIVDQFNKDPNTKLLLGNIDAAGVGLNITSTSVSLFCELSWVPAAHIQAENRTHGIKRGKEGHRSTSYYLVAKDTLEITLLEILQRKANIITTVLDGKDSQAEMDVMNLLTDALLKEGKP